MVINILDHVQQCYTQKDGKIIADLIISRLKSGEKVSVSFSGVYGVPSSFINAAFISLLEDFSFEDIRSRLAFANSTKLINDMIKKRFAFEVNKRSKMELCYA